MHTLAHVFPSPGDSYKFQVSWKSVEGLGAVGGRKSPSPIDKAHGLYNSLYYRTKLKNWRCSAIERLNFQPFLVFSCL